MRVVRVFLWTICVTYWVALFALTHMPRVPIVMTATLSDKAGHFLAYAVLGGVMYAALWASRSRRKRPALFVIAITLLYGAADEITQPLVGRTCEFYDWVADAAGAVFAVVVFASLRHIVLRGDSRSGVVVPDGA